MRGKRVFVAGAGGNIASQFVCGLARIPEVEAVALCDRDVYERRNLVNQNILPRDVGEAKVLVQARRLAEIRPNLKVTAIHAPIETLPWGAFRADLIVACLDSRSARQALNERAWRLGVKWADSGVLGLESLARVNVYAPSGDAPCLECAWADEDYKMLEQQYPCNGTAYAPAPNTATFELGGLAASMLVVECRKMLTGQIDCAAVGRQATLNARWHRLAVTSFRRNRNCRFDHAAWHVERLCCSARDMRIADLLGMAETVRVPGHRFVSRMFCPGCGSEKKLFRLEASLDAARRECGRCEKAMAITGFDIVDTLGRDLPGGVGNLTLEQAGLRYGEVLEVGDRYFEICANCEGELDDDRP